MGGEELGNPQGREEEFSPWSSIPIRAHFWNSHLSLLPLGLEKRQRRNSRGPGGAAKLSPNCRGGAVAPEEEKSALTQEGTEVTILDLGDALSLRIPFQGPSQGHPKSSASSPEREEELPPVNLTLSSPEPPESSPFPRKS